MSPFIVALNALPPMGQVRIRSFVGCKLKLTDYLMYLDDDVSSFYNWMHRITNMSGRDISRFNERIQALDRNTAASEPDSCLRNSSLEK
jgi:hypothetical protein